VHTRHTERIQQAFVYIISMYVCVFVYIGVCVCVHVCVYVHACEIIRKSEKIKKGYEFKRSKKKGGTSCKWKEKREAENNVNVYIF